MSSHSSRCGVVRVPAVALGVLLVAALIGRLVLPAVHLWHGHADEHHEALAAHALGDHRDSDHVSHDPASCGTCREFFLAKQNTGTGATGGVVVGVVHEARVIASTPDSPARPALGVVNARGPPRA